MFSARTQAEQHADTTMRSTLGILAAFGLTALGSVAETAALHASPPLQIAGVQFGLTSRESGAADVSGFPGDLITMRVAAHGAEEMAGTQFEIAFDPSVVLVEDVVVLGAGSGMLSAVNAANDGLLRVAYAATTASGLDIVEIADVTFKIVGRPGDATTLSIDNIVVADASLAVLRHSALSSSITVDGIVEAASPTPSPSRPVNEANETSGSSLLTETSSADDTEGSSGSDAGLAIVAAMVVLAAGAVIGVRRLRSTH